MRGRDEQEYMELRFGPTTFGDGLWGGGAPQQPVAPRHWGVNHVYLERFIERHPQGYEEIHTIGGASGWLLIYAHRLRSELTKAANPNIADGWRAVIRQAFEFFYKFDRELIQTGENRDPHYDKFKERLARFEQLTLA
jgi:hypothetical protein